MGNAFSCKICMRKRRSGNRFDNNPRCEHPFCKDCVAKYIISKVDDDAPDIGCPEPGCPAQLDPSSCSRLISEPVYARWRDLIREFNREVAKVSGNLNPDVDTDFALLVLSDKLQRCPRCKFFVQRIDGCRLITCRCGANFCYKCGGLWHLFTHKYRGSLPKENLFSN